MNANAGPIRLNVHFDPEGQRFWGDSPDLDGLNVEASSRAELRQVAFWAAEALFDVVGLAGYPELILQDAVQKRES